jgi:hypothetical protein
MNNTKQPALDQASPYDATILSIDAVHRSIWLAAHTMFVFGWMPRTQRENECWWAKRLNEGLSHDYELAARMSLDRHFYTCSIRPRNRQPMTLPIWSNFENDKAVRRAGMTDKRK